MWRRYVKDIFVFLISMIRYRKYIKWGDQRTETAEVPETTQRSKVDDHVAVLEMPERLDAVGVSVWSPIITDYLGQSEYPRFDLSGVRFIDSTGLGELIRIRKTLKDADRKYCFHQCSDAVLKLLKLTKLVDQFEISPDAAPLHHGGGVAQDSWGTRYSYDQEDQCKRIKWIGHLDDENAAPIKQATEQFILTSPRVFQRLEIDLTRVTQITSATVVAMKHLKSQSDDSAWELHFVGANDKVENVLDHAKSLHLLKKDELT